MMGEPGTVRDAAPRRPSEEVPWKVRSQPHEVRDAAQTMFSGHSMTWNRRDAWSAAGNAGWGEAARARQRSSQSSVASVVAAKA